MIKLLSFVVLSILTIEASQAAEECPALEEVRDILSPYAGKEDGNIDIFGKTILSGEWSILDFTGTLPAEINADDLEIMSEDPQSPGDLRFKKGTASSPKPPKPTPPNVRNFLYQKRGWVCCYSLPKSKSFIYLAKGKIKK